MQKGVLYTVDEFNQYVEDDINGFVTQVCLDVNNRTPTEQEMQAMALSYPVVSEMLGIAVSRNPELASAHIGLSMVKFEYKLPSAPAWCDLVLLGEKQEKKEAVIIELKDWFPNTTDRPGVCEGLMEHKGNVTLHPADQVKGYTQYCQNYHSAVLENEAEVEGCVFFTRRMDLRPYCAAPNERLTREYPVYNYDSLENLADYVVKRIDKGNIEWAYQFINGYYQQNRNILRQVAQAFAANSESRPFVLLEAQRSGFLRVMHGLDKAVQDKDKNKKVIVVAGPPGSGKSAIALNLWAEAVKRYVDANAAEHPGNVVFVATSSSQNDNWKNIFARYSQITSAGGLVMRSNNFNPGMNGAKMKNVFLPIFREKGVKYLKDEKSLKYEYYEEYTNFMLENGYSEGYCDNHHFLSIVDEAHALINPLAPNFCTNSLGGWCMQMGPQAYHIIRQSQVSVFLMDGEQSFRDNETTTIEDIRGLARRFDADVEIIDLSGLQFRCAGSAEYVEWVEGLFSLRPSHNVRLWKDQFSVQVCDSTLAMESLLREKIANGSCVRLLSSCSVPWISDKSLDEMHSRETENYDFDFVNDDGTPFRRHWNNPARMDIFVQAPPLTKMHEDPLCEVGCPYEIRGFDFDYVGILWLGDIVWRGDKWMLDLSKAVDRANKSSIAQAKREQIAKRRHKGYRGPAALRIPLVPLSEIDMPATQALIKTVLQAYRILMTRAVKGVFLYIKDRETREHVRLMLRDDGVV